MGSSAFSQVMRFLRQHGIVLQQDRTLPNVVSFVAGETLARSWWNHSKAHEIFRCLTSLSEHPDVVQTKLVAGKVTFVHRRLWPAVLGVGIARAPWQLRGLSAAGKKLLKQIDLKNEVLASGPDAKELERRLLAHGEQVHTDKGRHATRMESWQTWAGRVGCPGARNPDDARRELETAVRCLGGKGKELPWCREKS